MTACLSIQFGENDTACPGDPQATPKIPNVPVEELERLVKDSASQQRHQINLSSKGGFFRCKSSERSNDLRMSETESAKSIAELKTSNTISSEPHSAHARKVPNRVFCFFPRFLFQKSEAAAEHPPDRARATTQRISITAHQHNHLPTRGNQQRPQQQTTTLTNNKQQIHSHQEEQQHQPQVQQQQHATPCNNSNNCSIQSASQNAPLPHRCPRLRTNKVTGSSDNSCTKK